MAIEIVNCPMKIDIFKSYVRLPEGISIIRTYHRDITADTMIKVFRTTGRQLSEWPRFVFFSAVQMSKCSAGISELDGKKILRQVWQPYPAIICNIWYPTIWFLVGPSRKPCEFNIFQPCQPLRQVLSPLWTSRGRATPAGFFFMSGWWYN